MDSDVEMVKTSLKNGAGKAKEGDLEEADDEGGEDQFAKKRLKLVTVPASKRGAEYTRMFRAPYSRHEEQAVINFLLERGGFSLRKGTRVWREMEEERVCPGRSAFSIFYFHFLSDPGVPGVRSMDPRVTEYKRFLKLN